MRAGPPAPFAAPLGSLLSHRDAECNPFRAPPLFTICADVHRLELVMNARGWQRRMSGPFILILGIQDAAYRTLAGESLGRGNGYLGAAPMMATWRKIITEGRAP